MSLQTKFAMLVGVLALAVVSSLGAAAWSFDLLRRQLSVPFTSAASVLEGLGKIKRGAEAQLSILYSDGLGEPGAEPLAAGALSRRIRGMPTELLAPRPATEEEIRRFDEAAREIAACAEVLRREDWYRLRVGSGTWRNLTSRIGETHAQATSWLIQGDEEGRKNAGAGLFQIHELIEKTELRILADANAAVSYGRFVHGRLLLWLGCVFLVAALVCVLAVVLLKRWVQRPVAVLRQAAARIATGDLEHRVPVASRDELGQLSAEVNHMARMVQEMQEERIGRERLAAIGGMLRRLAHNVRNPLAGIRGLAEVTRHDLPEKSDGRENLDLIVSTVDTFERWLNELLESTAPEKVSPRASTVRAWIERVVETHRPMAQAKGVRLSLDTAAAPKEAMFDPRHLDHALAAIVSNAIEISPANEEVAVAVRTIDSDKVWEISVLDQGPGVADDIKDRIFEPHFTTKRHGNGIGLAVAKQVVKAHGGWIDVENGPGDGKKGRGARFRVRLPLPPAADSKDDLADNGR